MPPLQLRDDQWRNGECGVRQVTTVQHHRSATCANARGLDLQSQRGHVDGATFLDELLAQ